VLLTRPKPFEGPELKLLQDKEITPFPANNIKGRVKYAACGAFHCGAVTGKLHSHSHSLLTTAHIAITFLALFSLFITFPSLSLSLFLSFSLSLFLSFSLSLFLSFSLSLFLSFFLSLSYLFLFLFSSHLSYINRGQSLIYVGIQHQLFHAGTQRGGGEETNEPSTTPIHHIGSIGVGRRQQQANGDAHQSDRDDRVHPSISLRGCPHPLRHEYRSVVMGSQRRGTTRPPREQIRAHSHPRTRRP